MATTASTLDISGNGIARAIYHSIIINSAAKVAKPSEPLFNDLSTTQSFEKFKEISEFGFPAETSDGGQVDYQDRTALYDQDITPKIYTLGATRSPKAKFTDQYRVFTQDSAAIGRSFAHLVEKNRATLFINGFDSNFTGGDGKEVFNTAHPTNGGPDWSNRPAVDISLDSAGIRQAIEEVYVVKDARNKHRMPPDGFYLVVAPAKMHTAAEIIQSQFVPENADNAANVIRSQITRVILPYLTSSTNWFMVARDKSMHGLLDLTQMPLTTDVFGKDRVDLSDAIVGSMSHVVDWNNAHNTWGSNA